VYVRSDAAALFAELAPQLGIDAEAAVRGEDKPAGRGRARHRSAVKSPHVHGNDTLAGNGPRPLSVGARWSPDDPLNLALYNPIIALGLAPDMSALMTEDEWVEAMIAEAKRRDPITVVLTMQEEIATFYGKARQIKIASDDRDRLLAAYVADPANAWRSAVQAVLEYDSHLKRPAPPSAEVQSFHMVGRALATYGEALAALAWQGYQAQGRGLLMIDLDHIVTLVDGTTQCPACMYLPEGLLIMNSTQRIKENRELILGYVKRYDPAVGLVLLVEWQTPEGIVGDIYRTRFTVAPPTAYARLRDILPPGQVISPDEGPAWSAN
jgi:hypothetical protein